MSRTLNTMTIEFSIFMALFIVLGYFMSSVFAGANGFLFGTMGVFGLIPAVLLGTHGPFVGLLAGAGLIGREQMLLLLPILATFRMAGIFVLFLLVRHAAGITSQPRR